jgi:undecaprenyl-diphosphatase
MNHMMYLQATLLGVLQGVTEFLPISSSGHLVLLQHLFGVRTLSMAELSLVMAGILSALVVGDVALRHLFVWSCKVHSGALRFTAGPWD